jgi:hypothetical protein
MFRTQRRSILFMVAGLAVIGLVAGFASGADQSSAGLASYDVTLTPNYLSPLDPASSNYQAVWIYPTSPTTPYKSPDSQQHVQRYLLLDPRSADALGNKGNDDWWFIIQRYWPSSYPSNNHGDWGTEVNFHNVAGDAGPGGGVGWGFGTGVSSLMLEWLPGASSPQFGVEPNSPNNNLPLPPVTRDAWHTYIVHFVAGRTDGTTVHPGGLTVWFDGNDTPAINLSNINTVQRAKGPDGNWYTQRWMQLWEGDYTRNLQTKSTVRLALTRVGSTIAQALADRPVMVGSTLSGQYYKGSGINMGPPTIASAAALTAADGAIPTSLGGAGVTPTPPPPTTTPPVKPPAPTGDGGKRDAPPDTSGSDNDEQPKISLWWDGVHFKQWSSLKSHLQSRGVKPNAFLSVHPAIVKMLSVEPVKWEANRFYVRSSLARWLGAHGGGYRSWAHRHAGAAAKLAP